jgi:tetratricopeptide (TPR) repeat protein
MDEVNKGRTARMNEQANILFNFDISSSISGLGAGKIELSLPPSYLQRSLYAALARRLYTREGFESLGRRLAAIAHHAYFMRQIAVMQEASSLMLALPLSKGLHSVAQYYQALWFKKKGDFEKAYTLFEKTMDKAPSAFRPQVLLSIGATYFDRGEIESAVPFFLNASHTSDEHSLQTFATAQRMIAVVRSIHGDHQQAINDLERLFPIVRAIAKPHPECYYDFLNSYAVELGEVGRISEAQNVCAVALASTFAKAYPEISQTRDELEAKRTAATPSVVAVPAAAPEVIAASEAQPEAQAESNPEPARARSIISFKLRRACSTARLLAVTPKSAAISSVKPLTLLDQLPESILPCSPPALP